MSNNPYDNNETNTNEKNSVKDYYRYPNYYSSSHDSVQNGFPGMISNRTPNASTNETHYIAPEITPDTTQDSTPNRSCEIFGSSMPTVQVAKVAEATEVIQEEKKEPPKKKERRMAATIAAMLAIGVISGATGGGTMYMVMTKYQPLIQPAQGDIQLSSDESEASQPDPLFNLAPSQSSSSSQQSSSKGGIASVVEQASDSVVEISVMVEQNNPFYGMMSGESSGSGVILTSDGYIATNNHVVQDGTGIKVRTKDGTEYEATVMGMDQETDLAVIKIDAVGLKPVVMGDSDDIQVGELSIAIGNPLGTLGGTVTDGIISAKNREITIEGETMTLIQTSAAVNPGNSGGGLFNSDAQLIGIVNAKSSGDSVEGLGFAIPSNIVKQVAEDIIENGYVTGRPELGISIVQVSDQQTAFIYRVNEMGLYVATVTKENGLKPGDLFVSANGKEIKEMTDLRNILKEHKVGDTLEIVVKREGKETNVSVVLAEKIPENVIQRRTGSPV